MLIQTRSIQMKSLKLILPIRLFLVSHCLCCFYLYSVIFSQYCCSWIIILTDIVRPLNDCKALNIPSPTVKVERAPPRCLMFILQLNAYSVKWSLISTVRVHYRYKNYLPRIDLVPNTAHLRYFYIRDLRRLKSFSINNLLTGTIVLIQVLYRIS